MDERLKMAFTPGGGIGSTEGPRTQCRGWQLEIPGGLGQRVRGLMTAIVRCGAPPSGWHASILTGMGSSALAPGFEWELDLQAAAAAADEFLASSPNSPPPRFAHGGVDGVSRAGERDVGSLTDTGAGGADDCDGH